MGNSITVFLVVVAVVVALGGSLYVRGFLTRRAVFKVIDIFYQHQSLDAKGAKTPHELGLERPDFLQRMMKPRDYKQYALQILIKKEIILQNDEGKLYLVEERLDQDLKSKAKNRISPGRL
jgi:hypothetical protein